MCLFSAASIINYHPRPVSLVLLLMVCICSLMIYPPLAGKLITNLHVSMIKHDCSTLSSLIANNLTKTHDLNFTAIRLSCLNVWDLVRPVGVSCYVNLRLTRHPITLHPLLFANDPQICATGISVSLWGRTRITGSEPDRFTFLSLTFD